MTETEKQQLEREGYIFLRGFMDGNLLEALRSRVEELFAQEGESAGSEFKQEPNARRLANLVDKGAVFQQTVIMPEVLECVGCVLGPDFKLSSLNARVANPLSDSAQPLHCDAGAILDDKGYWVCNSVWMLDDFTSENGALRVIPGSHHWGRLPQDVLSDAAAHHPDEVLVTGQAGTVVVMNAHLWHGGTANRSSHPRRAMHAFYCRRDKPQQQYQKKLIRPEVQQQFSPELRQILALDDPLNDELSSRTTHMSGFMK
ncbi:MAG: phytanoyl-CoA dioxygenase family protein [Acidobacteriota bacterium]